MKTVCRYTGLDLLSSSGFARWVVVSEHPIFVVPLDELINMAANSWSPEMFVLDKKLLLLAIAKNCELISWEANKSTVIANPSLGIIESSIQSLLSIAGWIDYQRNLNKHSSYPTFRITEETANMYNFPTMLQSIIESRDVTEKQERREHRLICLENNARNLSAKCRIGANRETALLRTTAEWAMTVTEDALNAECISAPIRIIWQQILQMTPTALQEYTRSTMYKISAIESSKMDAGDKELALMKIRQERFTMADVEELRDFLTDNLPHGSVIAYDVIAHLHRLVEVNVLNDIDGGAILGARILQTGSIVASDTEPKREQFASVIEYARARAHWNITQSQKEATMRELAAIARQQNKQAKESDNADDI